jgi:hypothetical protein
VASVSVFAFSDVASATDGLSIEWSTDNANWDETDDFTIPAGNAKIFSFGPPARYMRVIYTNGGVGQAAFRLQTITKSVRVKPSSHRINDPILTEDDAELTKSVLTGEDPGGDFINFGATSGGNFKVSIEEVNGTAIAPVTGDVADDAVDSGNPVKIGGVAVETDGTDPTSVAEDDRAEVRTDRNRRLLVNGAHPNLWSNNNNWGAAQTDTQIQAAPGASLSLYITDIEMSAEGACNITLVRNTAASVDIFGPFYFAANGGLTEHFTTPIRLPANENLGVTSSAAVNHTVSVQGYTAP